MAISAMVVSPWILPLQAMAMSHLVVFPSFGSEVMNRTSPNLLDLGVALVAGAVAMYAKLRKEAISALAGLAIAVALVPPMYVVGRLLASSSSWMQSYGALLLFATNLLGIMVRAMAALETLERV